MTGSKKWKDKANYICHAIFDVIFLFPIIAVYLIIKNYLRLIMIGSEKLKEAIREHLLGGK